MQRTKLQKLVDSTIGYVQYLGLILMVLNFRGATSISNMYYQINAQLFTSLLMFPVIILAIDAYDSHRKYNYLLASFVFGVALFPHQEDCPVWDLSWLQWFTISFLHYTSALLYFVGNAYFAIKYTNSEQRPKMVSVFGSAVLALAVTNFTPEQIKLFEVFGTNIYFYPFYVAEAYGLWAGGWLLKNERKGRLV